MQVKKLYLRPAGMFSNVNEVIQHIHLATCEGYAFEIDWSKSCYKDPSDDLDPWAYYFEPCFRVTPVPDPEVLPTGAPVACTINNIITPRKKDGECKPLLLPKNREYVNSIIENFIHLKPDVLKAISNFTSQHFHENVIGVHLRGAGRIDGGALEAREQLYLEDGVPFKSFFAELDKQLAKMPNSKLFLCSDSENVIKRFELEYKSQLITYPSTRSDFGEMHANHPENSGKVFPKKKLGMDVLVEAYLLAECDFFIHGNSNVANFVLCKSPLLDHVFINA